MILDYEENHKGDLTKLGTVWKIIKQHDQFTEIEVYCLSNLLW